jgi:hypothetical protein
MNKQRMEINHKRRKCGKQQNKLKTNIDPGKELKIYINSNIE